MKFAGFSQNFLIMAHTMYSLYPTKQTEIAIVVRVLGP